VGCEKKVRPRLGCEGKCAQIEALCQALGCWDRKTKQRVQALEKQALLATFVLPFSKRKCALAWAVKGSARKSKRSVWPSAVGTKTKQRAQALEKETGKAKRKWNGEGHKDLSLLNSKYFTLV
jgi:hypothetical protein